MSVQLRGKPVAEKILENIRSRIKALPGEKPCLAVVRAGDKEDDTAYENSIKRNALKCGIKILSYTLHGESDTEKYLSVIDKINSDPDIHGCLILRPLPRKADERAVCLALDAEKDVDGCTEGSMIRLYSGKGKGFAPCTAKACLKILDAYGIDLEGKHALVIGRSLVIGKPVSMLLLERNCSVTVCHSRSGNIAEMAKNSDILIAAAGKAGMVTEDFTNQGQVIIDVGIHMDGSGKYIGDVCYESVKDCCAAITPVPGGVGSVTTAVLLENVMKAAEDLWAKKQVCMKNM